MNELLNKANQLDRKLLGDNDPTKTDLSDQISSELQFVSLIHGLPPWLVSTLVHIALILVLAVLTLTNVADNPMSLNVDTRTGMDEFTEITVLDFDELNIEQESLVESMIGSEEEVAIFAQVTSPITLQTTQLSEFSDFNAGLGEMVEGLEPLVNATSTTSFFGAEQSAQKVVFVVDNSNSMRKGKFETALAELSKSIDELSPNQQFHVIFFSDTAYLMFHPRPVKKLVSATEKNKERLRDWLYSAEMCLKTKGEDAMNAAIAMRPDVIYILGDGAFTDQTEKLMTARHNRKIVVNTLGMQVDPKGRRQLVAIAKANNGEFRDVEAARQAARMASQNPIKRNSIRGKIWGISLPLQEKRK